jgi:molybdopterin molybdotransferase
VPSFEEALATVLRETSPLASETVELSQALGRVLAEDVLADADLPAFDRAAMDGYALHRDDLPRAPLVLEVAGELRAGQWPGGPLRPGSAVRIMTGAPVPEGTAAVVPVEQTRPLAEARVEIATPPAPGAHVARRGCEVRAGDCVLAPGRVLDPAALAVLAAVGHVRPRVARRPVVAILVTGDEIVDAAEAPARGQVRNSNGPALAAAARQAGAEVRLLGIAPDRRDALDAALARGLDAEVLLACGGVSMGDYDLVEPALLALGARFFFTHVAIKPGAPLVFGRRGATLVFGLPGNPVSAQVTFELFVRPCLLRLQGAAAVVRRRVCVTLLAPLRNRSGRTSHTPARVRSRDGRLVAEPVRSAGSADLVAHARANALLVLEADRSEAAAGETVEALLLGGFPDDEAPPL